MYVMLFSPPQIYVLLIPVAISAWVMLSLLFLNIIKLEGMGHV
jgi:hypothetical protein